MRYLIPALFLAAPALADLPVVEGAVATQSSSGWSFSVSVRHADEGWDHYADGWTVFALDGTELGTRLLAHPHVEEQPFTRSQSGIAIPDGTERVIVRAHDNVHGWGPDFVVDLPR
ncbi:hypothetical protein [Jannaschia donghaensis]|uniref:Uncharacterized protein n=1 Tax=Jannaschia donghaensis TaxID=420998 RepID=A0A0M6YFZ3_9RHOB|nr:hypothetical protein [Jannaschia donghaensis]CTQ48585.1 hypothetical protein JDO7802_00588 [Jannaschia donghaensis]